MAEFIITLKESDDYLHYIVKNYEHMSRKEYCEFVYDAIYAYREEHKLENVTFKGDLLPVFKMTYSDKYGTKVSMEVSESRRKSAELN